MVYWASGRSVLIAVKLLEEIRQHIRYIVINRWEYYYSKEWRFTDYNAAIFDVANHFKGCIPGIHEVLRRQGIIKKVPGVSIQMAAIPRAI